MWVRSNSNEIHFLPNRVFGVCVSVIVLCGLRLFHFTLRLRSFIFQCVTYTVRWCSASVLARWGILHLFFLVLCKLIPFSLNTIQNGSKSSGNGIFSFWYPNMTFLLPKYYFYKDPIRYSFILVVKNIVNVLQIVRCNCRSYSDVIKSKVALHNFRILTLPFDD